MPPGAAALAGATHIASCLEREEGPGPWTTGPGGCAPMVPRGISFVRRRR